jgi:hypothetical protein
MRRLIMCGLCSLGLYWVLFGFILSRPLSVGLLGLELSQKAHALRTMPSPKLVILAGSNGPYSHSCVILSEILNMPCENAGIAVGFGLDDIFAHYAPYVHAGDVIYMPMELQQYPVSRRASSTGPDSALLLRRDRTLLASMSLRRIVSALFCCNVTDLLDSLVEMPMAHTGAINPTGILQAQYNSVGDRIDADPSQRINVASLSGVRGAPSAQQIRDGYGTQLISSFIRQETHVGVIVIGGMPTDFQTVVITAATLRSVAAVYNQNGGRFLLLTNQSRYPEDDFFNSEDHLTRPCQAAHSILLGYQLASFLGRTPHPPAASEVQMARQCPVAA